MRSLWQSTGPTIGFDEGLAHLVEGGADIFLMPPEVLVRKLFHDQKLAEQRLAEPVTPEALDIALKNRHTTARLAWEPRLYDPHLPKWLHRIDVPVKIVWGRQDRILPVLVPGIHIDSLP